MNTVQTKPIALDKMDYYENGNIKENLFSIQAEAIAKSFKTEENKGGRPKDTSPKISQIRKFYNEVLNLQNSINLEINNKGDEERAFKKWLPYIRMLAAKVTYSKSRERVNAPFEQFIKNHTAAIKDYKDFTTFVSLFEAVIAYSTGILKDK